MTLGEAIKYYFDLSKNIYKCAEISASDDAKQRLIRTANQHMQIVEWLKELQRYREQERKQALCSYDPDEWYE